MKEKNTLIMHVMAVVKEILKIILLLLEIYDMLT